MFMPFPLSHMMRREESLPCKSRITCGGGVIGSGRRRVVGGRRAAARFPALGLVPICWYASVLTNDFGSSVIGEG